MLGLAGTGEWKMLLTVARNKSTWKLSLIMKKSRNKKTRKQYSYCVSNSGDIYERKLWAGDTKGR